MLALIEDLRALGLRFEQEGAPPGEGPLSGNTFVLTGTLPSLTREEATERILAAGGRVTLRPSLPTTWPRRPGTAKSPRSFGPRVPSGRT